MAVNGLKIAAIINPRSAGGRTGRQWPEIEHAIRAEVDELTVFHTEAAWHAKELAQRALKDGFNRIVSVGGDGTHHEVINGFFDGYLPINPAASLALVPSGTGSDFARTLQLHDWRSAIPWIAGTTTKRIDIGRATFTLPSGDTGVHYFMNVADFGIGGAVVERVNRSRKRLGPFLTFLKAVLLTLPTFRSPHVKLQIDGTNLDIRTLNVIVAKGQYYGGGIHVAREAKLDNGTFEVLIIKDLSLFTALWNLPSFYSGSYILREDLVRYFRATRVVAQSGERVLLDLDGEQPGQLPAALELLPAALEVAVGPPTA